MVVDMGGASILGAELGKSIAPFSSPSGLLLADGGAEELVGVVTSIGSPGEGADILMVGVIMGMVRAVIGTSGPFARRGVRCALSVAAAIRTAIGSGQFASRASRAGQRRPRERGEAIGMGEARRTNLIASGDGRTGRGALRLANVVLLCSAIMLCLCCFPPT